MSVININQDAILEQYKELWDAWYNNPTLTNAEELLDFLQNPEDKVELEQIAASEPVPGWSQGNSFDHYYDAAVDNLSAWIQSGGSGSTADVSEWLNDVWVWDTQQPTQA